MIDRTLTMGCYRYEHTGALFDGTVAVDGFDVRMETASIVTTIFQKVVQGELDLSELGLTYFLRAVDDGAPFVALPIFPNRNFRHSAIFVNTDSGIEKPEDLAGKTIGEFALYGHDAGVWPKGILADDYGVTPDQCRWVIGGTNNAFPELTWIPQPVPGGVDVRHAPDGQALGAMLEDGEIDALISVDVPQAVLDGSPRVARLFPDFEAEERSYYARTGIFPPMHVVAVRAELADEPGLVEATYQAFCQAKELVMQRYRDDATKQHMGAVNPWLSSLVARNRRLLGDDWWPYGLRANRHAIDTFLRYHHEQGLSQHRLTSDDIFVPHLLDT